MTRPATIKPAIIALLKHYPSLTVERICFMSGFSPDAVRRVLREAPAFYRSTSALLVGRVWSYDPDRAVETPPREPKECPEKRARWKASAEQRESRRLKDPYVQSERVWGI